MAGHITLMALIVLVSFTPYLPIKGADENTIMPINSAHTTLNMVTTRIVFVILLCSPL